MKRFNNKSSFNQIFIPLVIPVLHNNGLVQFSRKEGPFSQYKQVDEVDPNTIWRLTKRSRKYLKTIRNGSCIRSGNVDEKEIFDNIFRIINGHLDEDYEEEAFVRYMKKQLYIPAIKI